MEMLDDPLLAGGVEVDEDIATENHVEGFDEDHARIIKQIQAAKPDVLAHLVTHRILA